jgi:hypothetical protein
MATLTITDAVGGARQICGSSASATRRTLRSYRMRIFVGNLAFTTTEEELHRLFYGYGAVERAQIMTDRETGRPRALPLSRCPIPLRPRPPLPG